MATANKKMKINVVSNVASSILIYWVELV
jgi:hypothetical protein